jgi:hypothetical protein
MLLTGASPCPYPLPSTLTLYLSLVIHSSSHTFFYASYSFPRSFLPPACQKGVVRKEKEGETERWILWITLTIYSLRLVGEQTGNHGSSVKYLFLSSAGEERKKKAHKSHRRKMPCLSASLFASSAHPFKGHTPRCFFLLLVKKWT